MLRGVQCGVPDHMCNLTASRSFARSVSYPNLVHAAMRSRTIAGIAVGGTLVALIAAYGVALQVDLGGVLKGLGRTLKRLGSEE